jgi:multimeric flavodoxin WrbA
MTVVIKHVISKCVNCAATEGFEVEIDEVEDRIAVRCTGCDACLWENKE